MGDLTREQIEEWHDRTASVPDSKIRALCAMALRALDTGWRSMESAPRDGTRILVALHGGYHKLASFERCEDYDGRLIEHFVCDGAGHSLDPLAWMPLPPPFTGDPATPDDRAAQQQNGGDHG